jgi:sugar/nucleoside kinase (ribokinase family)
MSTRAQTHSLFVGLATLDIILGVEIFPDSNQKVVASRESIADGGPAANAAVTCAFLGCPAVVLTALGGTSLAEVIRAELAEQSVSVVDMDPKTACPPPVAAIIVTLPSGDRTVVSPGAVQSTAEPNETFGALILASCAVLVDGHHPKLALAAVRSARETGIHTILDGGNWKKTTGTLLPFVDTAICSNDFRPPDVRREDILEFLQAQGVRHCCYHARVRADSMGFRRRSR